jgi:ATP-binding cassette, subfamily F, member 3
VLFAGVSLQVVPGRRIALVGANGTGKTTLLDLLAGDQEPDGGTVSRAKDLQVGYLRQDVAETRGRTVLAEVLTGAADVTTLEGRLRELEQAIAATPPGDEQQGLLDEYGLAQDRFEHLGGYEIEAQARQVLAGLGFDDAVIERDVGELSGGWMMRVTLARLLLARPDVLLLDEPTNHLDLASVRWLEAFLADFPGALVLVSHDRDFINALADRVVELSHGSATEYVGNYADFVEQRELRMEQLRAAARNQGRKIAQTERFIERFRYKNTIATRVQSRIKQLEKLDRIEVPDDDTRKMKLRFPAPRRSGRDVIALRGVVQRYGDNTVYDGLDLVLERGQKVALVGPNGAGKSTLLKILAGVLPIDGGERVLGHNVSVAYYAQHHIDALDLDQTVLQQLSEVVDTSSVNPRSILGAFLFSGEEVDKRVGVLSGGEKARLALARLIADPANLLCMDEPTNHLDIAARDVLEDALTEFAGTVVLITHDRHLIRSVANTVIAVTDGQVTVYPGGWEYYESKSEELQAPPGAKADEPADLEPGRKRTEAERRNRLYRATKDLRVELATLEEQLEAAERDVAETTRLLAAPDVYDDPERVRELVASHDLAADRVADLTSRWETLAEALERAEAEHAGTA